MPDLSHAALRSACQALGLDLTGNQLRLLGRYAGLLREWNERFNLISRGDTGRILSYHVIDSLAVSRLVPPDARVGDIGSGAGLPGIPLAIARPDLEVLLVESTRKKCLFLEAARRELNLTNLRVLEARAETLAPLACRVILSRLTGPLRQLIKQAHHHLAARGQLVLFKTADCREELALAAKTLARHGLSVSRAEDVVLPVSGVPRRFVVIAAR